MNSNMLPFGSAGRSTIAGTSTVSCRLLTPERRARWLKTLCDADGTGSTKKYTPVANNNQTDLRSEMSLLAGQVALRVTLGSDVFVAGSVAGLPVPDRIELNKRTLYFYGSDSVVLEPFGIALAGNLDEFAKLNSSRPLVTSVVVAGGQAIDVLVTDARTDDMRQGDYLQYELRPVSDNGHLTQPLQCEAGSRNMLFGVGKFRYADMETFTVWAAARALRDTFTNALDLEPAPNAPKDRDALLQKWNEGFMKRGAGSAATRTLGDTLLKPLQPFEPDDQEYESNTRNARYLEVLGGMYALIKDFDAPTDLHGVDGKQHFDPRVGPRAVFTKFAMHFRALLAAGPGNIFARQTSQRVTEHFAKVVTC